MALSSSKNIHEPMLILSSTNDLIAVTPAQSASIEVHASWVDNNAGTITPGRTNTAANAGTSRFTVVASPGGSTQRNVKFLSVKNDHASDSSAIDIEHYDGTTYESLWKGTLLAGESVDLNSRGVWTKYDATGKAKVNVAPGRFIGLFSLSSVQSATRKLSFLTNTIRVRIWASGGGGGNATGNASQIAVGGGGGGGGYIEKWLSVTPGSDYSYVLQGTTTAGTNGAASTFTYGATVLTANGGFAGSSLTQTNTTPICVPGGAGAAISTNGDINGSGGPGLPGLRVPGTALIASNSYMRGAGGGSQSGSGGGSPSGSAGNGAVGRLGGGGSGGLSNTTGANNGGGGSGASIIIEEYT